MIAALALFAADRVPAQATAVAPAAEVKLDLYEPPNPTLIRPSEDPARTVNGLALSSGDQIAKADYYAAVRAKFAANPSNRVLGTAIANLGYGNGASDLFTSIAATSAQLRANGMPVRGYYEKLANEDETPFYDFGEQTLKDGGRDGVVFLGSRSEMKFGFDIPAYDGTPGSVFYPAINTIQHEIMHILGGGSTNIGSEDSLSSLDLYRYAAPRVPNFAADGAYFSINGGVTRIQAFNGRDGGDYAGWGPNGLRPTGPGSGGPIGLFMNAFSCSNQPVVTFNLNSIEAVQLMALGWNPIGTASAVPKPSAWMMMAAGLGCIGATLRRRRGTARAVGVG